MTRLSLTDRVWEELTVDKFRNMLRVGKVEPGLTGLGCITLVSVVLHWIVVALHWVNTKRKIRATQPL